MSDLLKRRISRRGMMRGAAVGAATAALSACQPKIVEVTREVEKVVKEVVKETIVVGGTPQVVEKEVTRVVVEQAAQPQGETVVHFLTQLWNWQKLNMATATDEYNRQMRGKVRIEVDPAPDGWETKVVQMIRDGDVLWDGHLRARNVGDIYAYRRMDIIQPWDAFIDGSQTPWAAKYWDELLATVREAFSFEGKLYALPWDAEIFTRVYRKPEWDALGTQPAETLLEFEEQLLELGKMFPDKVPFGFDHRWQMPNHVMFMQLWVDNPYIQEDFGSVVDVRSDAYKQMLLLWKRWMDTGIITEDSWGPQWDQAWNRGQTLTVQTGAAWALTQSRTVWGREAIVPTTNFVLEKGDQPKTLTFQNAAVLFRDAKHPQEITDWLLWMLDPTVEKAADYSFHLGYLNYYHLPVYQSVFDNIVPKNPGWDWISTVRDQLAHSIPIPADARTAEFGPVAVKWEQQYMAGAVSLEECAEGIYEEVRALIKESAK